MKKVYIVGIGMDGDSTITIEGKKAIEKASLIIGAKRIVENIDSNNKDVLITYNSSEIAEKIHSSSYSNIAVLMSGDCGFYSGSQKLLPLLCDDDVTVIPAISSLVAFCSKIHTSYSDVKAISLHGVSSNIAINVATNRKCFFLLGGDITAKDVCNKLCKYGLCDVNVYIGENLYCNNEKIHFGKASSFSNIETDNLTVMLVENKNALEHIPSSIDDSLFIRDKVPMTKKEVRTICIANMQIKKDATVWDIGCGSGSISVEAAYRCYDGTVYAIDKKELAIKLTCENASKFACDNITTILGDAKEVIYDLPSPDCVFIGGGSNDIASVIKAAYEKNKNVKVVITAVSLETLNTAKRELAKASTSPISITQVAITRCDTIGTHTMLKAENPIFVVCI